MHSCIHWFIASLHHWFADSLIHWCPHGFADSAAHRLIDASNQWLIDSVSQLCMYSFDWDLNIPFFIRWCISHHFTTSIHRCSCIWQAVLRPSSSYSHVFSKSPLCVSGHNLVSCFIYKLLVWIMASCNEFPVHKWGFPKIGVPPNHPF